LTYLKRNLAFEHAERMRRGRQGADNLRSTPEAGRHQLTFS
jgi:hypothetical protein